MRNRKWTLDSPFYVHFKKHYCPNCNGELMIKRIKKVVDPSSPEAKDFDFSSSGGDGFALDEVEFSFEVFYCPNCNREVTIREMKKHEREQRRIAKNSK